MISETDYNLLKNLAVPHLFEVIRPSIHIHQHRQLHRRTGLHQHLTNQRTRSLSKILSLITNAQTAGICYQWLEIESFNRCKDYYASHTPRFILRTKVHNDDLEYYKEVARVEARFYEPIARTAPVETVQLKYAGWQD
jgi:hypothetical protein